GAAWRDPAVAGDDRPVGARRIYRAGQRDGLFLPRRKDLRGCGVGHEPDGDSGEWIEQALLAGRAPALCNAARLAGWPVDCAGAAPRPAGSRPGIPTWDRF